MSVLSKENQDLFDQLVENRVLHVSRLDDDLSRTLIVTDSEYPYPTIVAKQGHRPMFTLAFIGGGMCAYEKVTSEDDDDLDLYEGQEGAATSVLNQIRYLCLKNVIDTIALVTRVPSLATAGQNLTDILVQMMRADRQVAKRNRRVQVVVSFLSIQLGDGREFDIMVDPISFQKWHLACRSLEVVTDFDPQTIV